MKHQAAAELEAEPMPVNDDIQPDDMAPPDDAPDFNPVLAV